MVNNQARPLEPWNPPNDLNARRYASWTTSCASSSLRSSHLARLCAASRCGSIIASKDVRSSSRFLTTTNFTIFRSDSKSSAAEACSAFKSKAIEIFEGSYLGGTTRSGRRPPSNRTGVGQFYSILTTKNCSKTRLCHRYRGLNDAKDLPPGNKSPAHQYERAKTFNQTSHN